MVKKLIKYDFSSYLRLILPVQLVILGIALINRIIQLFEVRDSIVYSSLFGSSVGLLVVACIVCVVMTIIVSVIRFYQGLYSHEGYLNHTLPVTVNQHIFAKLLTSMMFVFGSLFTIFIAICIATFGDVNIELFKAAGFLLKEQVELNGIHIFLYILEAIIFLILRSAVIILMFYFCISIGQLANRKKILLAAGVFFGLYAVYQFVSMAFTIFFGVFNEQLVEEFFEWLENNAILGLHLGFLICIVVDGILALVFFFVSRYIMSKKLNLS